MGEIKYTTSNLLEFETVMDLDFAIAKLMIEKYKNSKYMKVTSYSSENALKNILLFRKEINPVTAIIEDDYLDSADELLEEFKEKYMDEILSEAKPTDVFRYVKTLDQAEGIIISTIDCKNQQQKQLINKIDSSVRTCINETDISVYSCLFIKDIKDIIKYKNLGGKYIFILNCAYNMDENFMLKPGIMVAAGYNKIRTIDPYIGLTLPQKGEMKK